MIRKYPVHDGSLKQKDPKNRFLRDVMVPNSVVCRSKNTYTTSNRYYIMKIVSVIQKCLLYMHFCSFFMFFNKSDHFTSCRCITGVSQKYCIEF